MKIQLFLMRIVGPVPLLENELGPSQRRPHPQLAGRSAVLNWHAGQWFFPAPLQTDERPSTQLEILVNPACEE